MDTDTDRPDTPQDAENPFESDAHGPTGQMVTSRLIGALAGDLALAQGEIEAPAKDRVAKIKSDKGSYEYAYADLTAIIEAIQGPFSRHGLAYVQTLKMCPDGVFALITRLVHTSGQWIESEYPLVVSSRQTEMGSAITFARRYSLQTLAGISASEDTDSVITDGKVGELSDRKPDRKPAGREVGTPPPPPTPSPPFAPADTEPTPEPRAGDLINEEQRAELQAAAHAGGHKAATVRVWLSKTYGIKGSREVTQQLYPEVLWRLSSPEPLIEGVA